MDWIYYLKTKKITRPFKRHSNIMKCERISEIEVDDAYLSFLTCPWRIICPTCPEIIICPTCPEIIISPTCPEIIICPTCPERIYA